MIAFESVAVDPPRPSGGLTDRLDELAETLARADRTAREVLSITVFAAAPPARAELLDAVRRRFGDPPPAVTVVAQPPGSGAPFALEAAVLALPADDLRVERAPGDGGPVTVVTGRGVRQLHGNVAAAAVSAGDGGRAREAFAAMKALLLAHGMDFGHVVRQWGYVEGLLEVRGERQGYQVFNDVRAVAYQGSAFPRGFPAATGIGQASGGVVLEFVAVDAPADVRIEPVSNPRQTDAHRYSDGVLVGRALGEVPGRCAPRFERAKRVVRDGEETVLVSGTASIHGERSVAVGDVAAQTRTTIENMLLLTGGAPLTGLRAYVKRPEDVPAVRRICREALGPIPSAFVVADVCRDELLVELEGARVVLAPAPGPTARRPFVEEEVR